LKSQNIGKTNNLKVLGATKPKGIHRIVTTGLGHLCLREDKLSFDNNYFM
jgi:hypothetical protein